MQRRRVLSGFLGLAALAAGGTAAGAKVHRVTLFAYFPSADAMEQTRTLWLARFRERGFLETRDLALTLASASLEPAEDERRARAVVATRPDVICVPGSEFTQLFMRLTNDTPIVFFNVADPVRVGLVANFNRPGANVTGVTNRYFELIGKRVELLKELRPQIRRIAIVHPEGPTVESVRAESEAAARRLGLAVQMLVLPARPDAGAMASALRQAKADGAIFTFGPEAVTTEVLRFLEQSRLPAVFADNTLVQAGGLASLGEKRPGHATRAIDMAARILRGEKPATIPVDQLATIHLAVNLRTARALGLAVPEAIRVRADEVLD